MCKERTPGTDVRLMTFNIPGFIAGDPHTDLAPRAPFAVETVRAFMPDFLCVQEAATDQFIERVGVPLAEYGYGHVGDLITTYSDKTKAAIAAGDTEAVKFGRFGKRSYTPIYYRRDLFELAEFDTCLFYWKDRWPYTDTKTFTYAVFRRKADGRCIIVMSAHFALLGPGYTLYIEKGMKNSVEGKQWRYENAGEMIAMFEKLRKTYPGALALMAGDFNAPADEPAIARFDAHPLLADAYNAAGEGEREGASSFHGPVGKEPPATGTPIDHVVFSTDAARVLHVAVIQNKTALLASDHCPVVADFAYL